MGKLKQSTILWLQPNLGIKIKRGTNVNPKEGILKFDSQPFDIIKIQGIYFLRLYNMHLPIYLPANKPYYPLSMLKLDTTVPPYLLPILLKRQK